MYYSDVDLRFFPQKMKIMAENKQKMQQVNRDFYPDIEITCTDGKVQAHKLFLLRYFKYFVTLFGTPIPTSQEVILAYKQSTVHFVTSVYIYDDKLPISFNAAEVIDCARIFVPESLDKVVTALFSAHSIAEDKQTYLTLIMEHMEVAVKCGFIETFVSNYDLEPDTLKQLIEDLMPKDPYLANVKLVLDSIDKKTSEVLYRNPKIVRTIIDKAIVSRTDMLMKYITLVTYNEMYDVYKYIINKLLDVQGAEIHRDIIYNIASAIYGSQDRWGYTHYGGAIRMYNVLRKLSP